jgi:hypothetical protein
VSPRQQRPQPQQPDAGVSDLNTSGSGSGGHALSLSQKSQKYKYCDDSSEATFCDSSTWVFLWRSDALSARLTIEALRRTA